MKLDERLKQIEKRIAELQRKADAIKAELPSVSTNIKSLEYYKEAENVLNEYAEVQAPRIDGYVEESHLFEAPRRRGRKKLNEAK